MNSARKTISVIKPCYNEELNITEAYEAVRKVFDEHLPGYQREHIFCDNASTDASQRMLRDLAARDPQVKVILNARNFGPMKNNYNGVMACTGEVILMFLPCDLQDPPELLPEFVKKWEEGYEIVYGIRAVREEGWAMRAIRGVYYHLLTSFSEVKVPPGVGDFQLIDRRVVESMREVRDVYPFLRMMTFEVGGPAFGIPYTWRARKRGFSKNRMTALVDQGLNGLISFTTAPLRIGLYVGFLIAFLSVIYAVVSLIIQLVGVGRIAPPGVPTLIVALFFFSGVQLFFMGLIAEYILAIYAQVRTKPVVFERERLNFTKGSQP